MKKYDVIQILKWESKEWYIDVGSKDRAIELAQQRSTTRPGTFEVRETVTTISTVGAFVNGEPAKV